MSSLPIENVPGLDEPAREAEGGQVVHLTRHGQPAAEIMPAGSAERLKALQDADDLRHIKAALASDKPGRRFGSVEEMLAALENVP